MRQTLRPNAAGDETNILRQHPDSGEHWDKVDEVEPDDGITYVRTPTAGRDLYNLPASVGSGTINKITLYFRAMAQNPGAYIQGAIKSDSIVTETSRCYPWVDFGFNVWGTYSQEWATNPADGEAWEWSDIDALQIGAMISGAFGSSLFFTQVYVEVDYTPEEVPPVVPPKLEGWLPMPPNMGPPLPRFLQIFWPFYRE